MKKIIVIAFIIFINYTAFSQYEYIGAMAHDININIGRTFDNNTTIFNINTGVGGLIIGNYNFENNKTGPLYLYLNWSSLFSFNINIFDIYFNFGFMWYPWKKYFSLAIDTGLGFSSLILNHLSYRSSIKGSIDIPIKYENTYHDSVYNITIGAGIQHRNCIKLFDYLDISENYFKIYNSYFFEIGFRISI